MGVFRRRMFVWNCRETRTRNWKGTGGCARNVDVNDTFCILDSADALPCRGLFRHVLKCNVRYSRLALNPFFCGRKCGVGEKAVGGECVPTPVPGGE